MLSPLPRRLALALLGLQLAVLCLDDLRRFLLLQLNTSLILRAAPIIHPGLPLARRVLIDQLARVHPWVEARPWVGLEVVRRLVVVSAARGIGIGCN